MSFHFHFVLFPIFEQVLYLIKSLTKFDFVFSLLYTRYTLCKGHCPEFFKSEGIVDCCPDIVAVLGSSLQNFSHSDKSCEEMTSPRL